MSKVHGFRVYLVKSYRNKVKDNDPSNASKGSKLRGEIGEILHRLGALPTHFTDTRLAPDGTERKPDSITVAAPVEVRQDLIHVEVSTGSVGSHEKAITPENRSEELDLEGFSPETSYYFTFLFPKDKCDCFLLITQTKHNFTPVYRLLQRMAAVSHEIREEEKEQDRAERATRRAADEKLGPVRTFSRLLFRHTQASDNRYLDSIFRDPDKASVKFSSKSGTNRGARGTQTERELVINLRSPSSRNAVKAVANVWRRSMGENDTRTHQTGVSEIGTALNEVDLFEEDEMSKYNEAKISIKDGDTGSTTIAVDTLRDVFTYRVSVGPPGYLMHYEHVASRIRIIALEAAIEVEDIDPREVEECLQGLTQTT